MAKRKYDNEDDRLRARLLQNREAQRKFRKKRLEEKSLRARCVRYQLICVNAKLRSAKNPDQETEQAKVNDSVNVVAERLLHDIKRLSEHQYLEISAKTEREAITSALLKALDIWSPNGDGPKESESQQFENGPAQISSPNSMRLSDKEHKNSPTSEDGGSSHADRGASNAVAAAPTASIQNPLTSDHLSGEEKIRTDTTVQVDSRKIPDSETQRPNGYITPISQLKEAPYIGASVTPESAPSAFQETAAPWPHRSGWWFPDMGQNWDQAAYAAPFQNLLFTEPERSDNHTKATSVASETLLKHLHRLNSEVRI